MSTLRHSFQDRLGPYNVFFNMFLLLACFYLPFTYSAQTNLPLTYEDILNSHRLNNQTASRQKEDLVILGFVTPWNANGKQIALTQAARHRLDITSPVSWQMYPTGLNGGHDFDDAFYTELSHSGSRVYPRVLFEQWTHADFGRFAGNTKPVVEEIVTMCTGRGFEGVVLEIWQALLAAGVLQGEEKELYVRVVRELGEEIRKRGVRTVLVLPPYTGNIGGGGITAADLERLGMGFNQFVVMTYDFSVPGMKAGPMAPLGWVRQIVKYLGKECGLGRKVLIGVNFYGVDFVQQKSGKGGAVDQHVVGHEYISLLKEYKPEIVWLDEIGEHAFGYSRGKEQHVVFYPSRRSIGQRVALAESLECGGIAIWELGQGLNYFFDEF